MLAEDVTASVPLPPFDNSAMDGYAVIAGRRRRGVEDTPVVLRVIGDIAAGHRRLRGHPGHLPAHHDRRQAARRGRRGGAGGVDRRRHWPRSRSQIPAAPGDSVRYRGGDARQGDVLLPAGTRLGPMQIAVLAASGRARAEVYPRPRVVVLSTGNELTEPGTPLAPGQIWDSNSYMLTAAAHEAGCLAYRVRADPGRPDGDAAARSRTS